MQYIKVIHESDVTHINEFVIIIMPGVTAKNGRVRLRKFALF